MSLYQDWSKRQSALLRTASALARPAARLSPLLVMSDPAVHDDVRRLALSAPRGAAIIYRHFGAAARADIAQELRQITFVRRQQLLIGADPELAVACGADGVHFTRDAKLTEPHLWRARCPDWLITMAGIKGDYLAYQGDLSVLDALLISSVFPSDSPSAGTPIGVVTFGDIAHRLPVPSYALGGVTGATAEALLGSGAAGVAGRFTFSP